jgi:hypothetical protein
MTTENTNILFRCSMVGALLTEPKLKLDKEKGLLSETSKAFVIDKWLYDKYGFLESIKNNYMDKGIECEQNSMDLVSQVVEGGFRARYNTKLQNDYVIGTPDIVLSDCVEDIKTSWNLKTFFNAELSKMYYCQAQCYMWLTGKQKYKLIYALVPTPEKTIINECEKLVWKYDKNYENEDYIKECQQIQRNNDLIKELPTEKRVKVFAFDYNPAYIELLKIKIERAREYYNTLKL